MRIQASLLIVAVSIAVIAVSLNLIGINPPVLRAAQEPARGPRSRLHVAARPPRILSSTPEDRGDYPRFLQTQMSLIRSELVLLKALSDPKISQLPQLKGQADPTGWLRPYLDVTNPKDSEILEIGLLPGSGLGAADQAAIINAVSTAYMDEVVNVELKRRMERFDFLKKLNQTYREALTKKRRVLRELSESTDRGGRWAFSDDGAASRLYQELRSQLIKHRVERAEVQALLDRRKSLGGAAADAARREMPQLEDRLAALSAGQKVLDEEMERLAEEKTDANRRELDLKDIKEEIALMEEAARKIAAEVEALTIEIDAPRRVRLIDEATAGKG